MDEPPRHANRQFEFLEELVEEHIWIDDDVLQFDIHSWAIHGFVPYDGQVPMAVFSTYGEARLVLEAILRLSHHPPVKDFPTGWDPGE